MKDVHRSRGYFPTPKETLWKWIKGKASHAARKDAPAKEKENVRARTKEKAQRDVLDHVSCARDLIGLVTVLHTMEERASVLTRSARDARTLHRFDKLTWNVTSMIGSQVQVLLQSLFHPCRILSVLTSMESSFSILEPQCPWEALICCREFKKCTCRPVFGSLHIPCHHFIFPSRTEKRTCRRVFCLCRTGPGKSYLHSSVEHARTSAVGSRCGRRFGTCRRSCRLPSVSESLEAGRHTWP